LVVIGSPFGADDQYMYLWKSTGDINQKLLVYYWNGDFVQSFDLTKFDMYCGGDERYFFINSYGGTNEFGEVYRLFAVDKSKLADGTATLEKVL
jgi:hypothetical protein